MLCDHCTLPLGGRVVVGQIDGSSHCFCCYGCLLAHQVTRASGEDGQAASLVIRLGLAIFLAMNVMMMSMQGYAPFIYGAEAAVDGPLHHVLRWLAMCFALPVLFLLGWPILRSFAAGGWAGGAVADALVLLGAVSAFALSVHHTLIGSTAVYFDTAVMVLLFVTLGRYLEARARADAGRAVRAELLAAPTRATLVREGRLIDSEVAALAPGDVVRVVAGEMFPTDGTVLRGEGSVDEALMTGESRLVAHRPGSAVAGGTCSVDGCFEVRVTRPAADSAAARIEKMLEEGRRAQSPMERLADRFARRFLPATLAIAVVAGVLHGVNSGVDVGVLTALSVLVVACPCALGIATPVALWFAVAAAARRGIVLRDAGVLERAGRVDRACFDKTGTLTERTPHLVACDLAAACPWPAAELLRRAAALELGQHHPIARAIVAAAGGDLAGVAVADIRVEPGRGVRGRVEGTPIEIVDAAAIATSLDSTAAAADAGSAVAVCSDGVPLAVLRFAERLRSDAVASLSELRDELGIGVAVLSGDSAAVALAPLDAARLEIATGLLPQDKLRRVESAAIDARRDGGAVAFVGDGVNDAPALAAADVGIAFGAAADLPRMAADVLCLGGELSAVPWLLRHARRSVRIVRQNLVLAFGYNSIAVALAAAGRLDPLVAALAMLGSSLAVVANARRAGRLGASRSVDFTKARRAAPQWSRISSSSSLR